MHTTSLPLQLEQLVENELDPGEQLLWTGQPAPGRFMAQGLGLSVFGLFFGGFALFWIITASGIGGGMGGGFSLFGLFGIPFLLVGLGMLTAPIWMSRKAKGTVYAITDKRAIVFDQGWSMNVRSFGPDKFSDLERRQRPDGTGDIIFAREPYRSYHHHSDSHYHHGRYRLREIGFFGVANVKEVEQMLRDLKEK